MPKCITKHSGDEEDDLYTGEWVFFHHLRFLTDTMKGRTMSGTLESAKNDENENGRNTIESQEPTEASVASSTSNTLNSVRSINFQPLDDTDYMEEVLIQEEEEDLTTFCSTKRSSSAGMVLNSIKMNESH